VDLVGGREGGREGGSVAASVGPCHGCRNTQFHPGIEGREGGREGGRAHLHLTGHADSSSKVLMVVRKLFLDPRRTGVDVGKVVI